MEPTSSSPLRPQFPPPRPMQPLPNVQPKIPPARPTQKLPVDEWEKMDVAPETMEFTQENLEVESEFADTYYNPGTLTERLSHFWKVQSVVADNLARIGELSGKHVPAKLHFGDDGHIECDASNPAERSLRGTFQRFLAGNDPDNIRNLAVFVVFLKKHYADYRHDNVHMQQEIMRLKTAIAGLRSLTDLYVEEGKNENLEILNKSIHQLGLCVDGIAHKIEENNALSMSQLMDIIEAVLVRLKLSASDSRQVRIAGLAQSMQAYDVLNVVGRTEDMDDAFGRFAKCVSQLSIGSTAEEYLLKELLLAEYIITQEEIVKPMEEELHIPQYRHDLRGLHEEQATHQAKFEHLKSDLKFEKLTLDDEIAVESDDPNPKMVKVIDLYISLEEKMQTLKAEIASKEELLQQAEKELPEGIKALFAKQEALIKDLASIKAHFPEDVKNLQARHFLKESELFPESLKLAGHPIDVPSQEAVADETTSTLQSGAQMVAGVAIAAFAFYNPTLAPLTMPLGVGLMKGALAGTDNPYLKQAEIILKKAEDPKKAREEILQLTKQAGDNTQLVSEIWNVYNKYMG